MNGKRNSGNEQVLDELRALARPLSTTAGLSSLVEGLGEARFYCIGEASHGTHEFYEWREMLTRRLIEERGFTWIGVEGDWPDCWRVNRWVCGYANQELDAEGVLARFERWPTWMWANHEVADFLEWLRDWNLAREEQQRVGFYGLDVYSLWDSLREVFSWLEENAPEALPAAERAWQCFLPYREDPHEYAWSTRLVPDNCEDDVVRLLAEVQGRIAEQHERDHGAFDAEQNAVVAAGAENYYRTMVRGDRQSWNVRDHHMVDTIERVTRHLGAASTGVIWEHNTHIGDARATDMAADGLVNVGQLLRERNPPGDVALVGFASHRGTVLAADAWGSPHKVFPVPEAPSGTHEHLLHTAVGEPAVLVFPDDRSGPWLSAWLGHRAIGVVYNPGRDAAGNYVPTRMGGRYDALIWLEETESLHPLPVEGVSAEREFETEPSGY